MKDVISEYAISSSEVYAEMATLSGLTDPETIIRLSPNQIDRIKNSLGCMTSSALTAFREKFKNLSGDCYVVLTSDSNGIPVLALDIVRPDKKDKKAQQYVMDQEPIYIRKQESWNKSDEARKITHLSCKGRTFDLSAYRQLSAYLEEHRDVPVHRSEISAMDPGLFAAISNGVAKAYPLSGQT